MNLALYKLSLDHQDPVGLGLCWREHLMIKSIGRIHADVRLAGMEVFVIN